jgi:hypothetical protein
MIESSVAIEKTLIIPTNATASVRFILCIFCLTLCSWKKVGLNRNIPDKLEKSGLFSLGFSGRRQLVLEKVVAGEIVPHSYG